MSESIDKNEKDQEIKKNDLMSISGSIITSINYKMGIFLFIIGMIIFSDVFINGALSNISGTVSGECTTTKGTIIQISALCGFYLVADLFATAGWV